MQPTELATARGRSAAQLDRQERAFALSVLDGKTYRVIAGLLGCDKDTVTRDIRAELTRRADEIADRRELEQAQHLALIEDLYQKAMAASSTPGTGAFSSAGKALEMRAKLLGLDAPARPDVALQTLVEALAPNE